MIIKTFMPDGYTIQSAVYCDGCGVWVADAWKEQDVLHPTWMRTVYPKGAQDLCEPCTLILIDGVNKHIHKAKHSVVDSH